LQLKVGFDMRREILGSFEYQVLSVLLRQPRDAYGVTIQERIQERTGRDVSVGSLYTTLDRLEKKGFVSSWWGDVSPERGGRRKRYYKIEAAGADAVRRSEAVLRSFGGRFVSERT
jgi:PadR family transcriptional regulator PadR